MKRILKLVKSETYPKNYWEVKRILKFMGSKMYPYTTGKYFLYVAGKQTHVPYTTGKRNVSYWEANNIPMGSTSFTTEK